MNIEKVKNEYIERYGGTEEFEIMLQNRNVKIIDSMKNKLGISEEDALLRINEIDELDAYMDSQEYIKEHKEIEEQCDKIKQMPLNTREDILKAKEASRNIPTSAEKVLLFKFLIMKEEEICKPNREKVREWVFKKKEIKRLKGFKVAAIIKDLGFSMEEVYSYCLEMAINDKILEMNYHLLCNCGFSDIYGSIAAIPKECEWCHREIDPLEDPYVEFVFKR